jgi:hypothetical protein
MRYDLVSSYPEHLQINTFKIIILKCIGNQGVCIDELSVDGLGFTVVLYHLCLVI